MKTENKYETRKEVKNYNFVIIISLIAIFIFCCYSLSNAQKTELLANNNSVFSAANENTNGQLINTLETIVAEGSVYLKWYVKDKNNNRVYLVERSSDGIKFETAGAVKAFGGKYDFLILNCFNDKQPIEGYSYYRIAALGEFGEKEYSAVNLVYNGVANNKIPETINPLMVNNAILTKE
jgi:hypothetical protein